MKLTKKIFAVVLSVLMMISVMPMAVFADGDIAQVGTTSTAVKYASLQEAIDAAVESGASKTVKLLADTNEDIVIPNTNGKTLTLKTNGKTISSVADCAITIKSGAIVVMNDTGSIVTTVSGKEAISNEFGGKLTLGTSSYAPKVSRVDGTTGYVIKNQGTMVIENATVTNGNANDTSALIANGWYNNDEAVDTVMLTIKKGTYTSTKGITVKNDAKGDLTISGGTFTHQNNSDNVQNWNVAKITGGTFNNRVRTIQAKDDTSIGQTTITGGTFNGEVVVLEYYAGYAGTTEITGGTFATKPNEDFIVAENAWYYETAAGKYALTTATPSVEIDGKQYPSMSIALAQNNYEGEYTLIADVPSFILPSGTDKADKTIVLNLNGYSVTEAGSGSAIKINGTNAKVTINGPGNVYAGKNSSTAATTVASAVWVTKVADVTINGGNYYAYTTTAGKANPVVYVDAIGTTLTINDGNFVGADAASKDDILKVRPTYASKADYVLEGGTYSSDPTANADVTVAGGFAADKEGGNFVIKEAEVNFVDGDDYLASFMTSGSVEKFAFETAQQKTDNIFTGWTIADHFIDIHHAFVNGDKLDANWATVSTIAKDVADEKSVSSYKTFGLAGVQIREENTVDINDAIYGGLRFVSSFGEDLLAEINSLSAADVEYGYVMASKANAKAFANHYGVAEKDYKIQYNTGVNGGTADTDFRYVTNVVCSDSADHRSFGAYRLFTAVIDFEGAEDLKNTEFVARAYIKYTDKNGVERIYYNDYDGTNTFGGCSVSYNQAAAM